MKTLEQNKTLVIVLGQARAADLTWESFSNFVLTPLKADLAVCVGEDLEEGNNYLTSAKYKWYSREYDDFGEGVDSLLESLVKEYGLEAPPNWRYLLRIQNQWLGGIKGEFEHPGSAGILLYFREFLLQKLLLERLHHKYDWFVITRSDFKWRVPHIALNFLDKKNIYIPYGEGYGGYTDRHAVVPAGLIADYLGIFRQALLDPMWHAQAMSFDSTWNLEKFIYFKLKTSQVKVTRMPYFMYSVRRYDTPTRWSIGSYDAEEGVFIKYGSEKKISKRISLLNTDFLNPKFKSFALTNRFFLFPITGIKLRFSTFVFMLKVAMLKKYSNSKFLNAHIQPPLR